VSSQTTAEQIEEQYASERLGLLQVLTLILSVYVLVALLVQSTVKLSSDTVKILEGIDFFVCLVFLADFFVRFYRTSLKSMCFLGDDFLEARVAAKRVPDLVELAQSRVADGG
jgi:hypothetical protein